MDFTVYAQRRARLAAGMQRGIAIVPTAPERTRNRDSHYPYRYDSYFYYLTGFREPDAVLVVIAGSSPQSILFCRDKNAEREIWDGFRYGPEGARTVFGFDDARSIEKLDETMPELLANQPTLHVHLGADAVWDERVVRWLNDVRARVRTGITAPRAISDVHAPLVEMRVVKDASEIQVMRRAAEISAGAHRRAMQSARPGATEY